MQLGFGFFFLLFNSVKCMEIIFFIQVFQLNFLYITVLCVCTFIFTVTCDELGNTSSSLVEGLQQLTQS